MLRSIRLLTTSSSEDSTELKSGAGLKKPGKGRANEILDTAKSSGARFTAEGDSPLQIEVKAHAKAEKLLRRVPGAKELDRKQDPAINLAAQSRETFNFEKSNLVGQKLALHQKIRCLESQLAQKEQMLTQKTASLQLAVEEYQSMSARLSQCKARKDAAVQRSHELHERVVRLEEERSNWKLANKDPLLTTKSQVKEAAAAWKLRQSVWSECQAITSLSSLACKAQRRVLELERKVHAEVDGLAQSAQPGPELQSVICRNLRQQLLKKDKEIEQLKAAVKEAQLAAGVSREAACKIHLRDGPINIHGQPNARRK